MTTAPVGVVILGSTGSIGTQALEVIDFVDEPAFQVRALAAGGSNLELLAQQAVQHQVELIALANPDAREEFSSTVKAACTVAGRPNPVRQILTGPDAIVELIEMAGLGETDVVVNGITGSVGLLPTLAALKTGATLALANKESLVVGGAVVKAAMRRPGQIVPVDSEHSALAQALLSGRHEKGLTSPVVTGHSEVRRLVLTASGGPFRGRSRASLTGVTAAQALNHPTWAMGPVVTINSSTLINKGLELIEAHLLFDIAPELIDVVVHPQSVVHSMVEFNDGATIAQASPPDMRLPIALGLTWPERATMTSAFGQDGLALITPCDWTQPVSWDFEPLDEKVFPAVALARQSVASSPTHPAVLNAANEQAVAAFINGALEWLDIVEVDAQVVGEHDASADQAVTLADVLAAETWARTRADELIAKRR